MPQFLVFVKDVRYVRYIVEASDTDEAADKVKAFPDAVVMSGYKLVDSSWEILGTAPTEKVPV